MLIGTPPAPNDPSEVFAWRRKKALDGRLGKGLYVEFSADTDADPDDKQQWAKANPSYPDHTKDDAFDRLKSSLDAHGFRREALGIWDDDTSPEPPLINSDQWTARIGTPAPDPGLICYGVKYSADGTTVGLVVAARRTGGDTGGPVHVEVIAEKPVSDGLEWLTTWLTTRWEKAAQIVIDGRAGSGMLAGALQSAGVGKTTILTPTVGQVIDAHSLFLELVISGRLTHLGQPGLDMEVGRAAKRPIGTQGGWGWAATTEGSIVGLEAATLAAWAAMTTRRYDDDEGGDRIL
jgi:hypothetical protein